MFAQVHTVQYHTYIMEWENLFTKKEYDENLKQPTSYVYDPTNTKTETIIRLESMAC